MTSLTVTAPRGHGRRRPGRPGLTWITWRQHRTALAGTVVLLGAFAVALAVTGLRMQSRVAAMARAGCPANGFGLGLTSRCGELWDRYYHAGYPLIGNIPLLSIALSALPVLVGVFIGAPLVAREVEAGTAKFAWTQAVSRGRWAAAKLGLLGVALAGLGVAFGALASWWLLLADAAGSSRWQPQQFGLTVFTFTGWMVFMFAAGVFAGTLIKRTVAAMAATAATGAVLLWLCAEMVTPLLMNLRPLRMATHPGPETLAAAGNITDMFGSTAAAAPPGSWVLTTWARYPDGRVVTAYSSKFNQLWGLKPTAQPHWLAQHHLTLWISYQSAGRFWLFQGVEGGAALLLALVLAGATVWLVRHRVA